jgi:hypothetical protein
LKGKEEEAEEEEEEEVKRLAMDPKSPTTAFNRNINDWEEKQFPRSYAARANR